jgi:hypothetical protein
MSQCQAPDLVMPIRSALDQKVQVNTYLHDLSMDGVIQASPDARRRVTHRGDYLCSEIMLNAQINVENARTLRAEYGTIF